MTSLRRRVSVPVVIALSLVGMTSLSACGAAENIVGGVVSETQDQVGDAVDSAVADAKAQMDDAISDALGGAGISTDGELPKGFPTSKVPIIGTVEGGGVGPDSSGWVVRTTLSQDAPFASAAETLESSDYVASAVNSDADSGFGTYTGKKYTVLLTVETTDGVVTATYVVTNK